MIPVVAILCTVALIIALTSCASRGVPTRQVIHAQQKAPQPDPPPGYDLTKSWYIEGAAQTGGKPYSCSFIEFDDRGDYLDFPQHRHAYEKIRSLAKEQRVAVVIFVHGWRNNSQSGNVVGFTSFLKQLANTEQIKREGMRVHGVYLGWRGGVFKPSPVADDKPCVTGMTGPIVDRKAASAIPPVTNILETLAYWTDKSLPESKISGTCVSRSIYTCAHTAKRHGAKERNRVFLIGHSFGALLLERTFMNSTLGELTKEWAWDEANADTNANPLPFDTVLLVNSAAPSIYAKHFKDYLAAHRGAMIRAKAKGADAPIFFSLTSEGDSANDRAHPIGNLFAGLSPTLQRDYHGHSDFILWDKCGTGTPGPIVPQSAFYRRTPGHNPLLVNRWIEPCKIPHDLPRTAEDCMNKNVELNATEAESMHFFTSKKDGSGSNQWEINPIDEALPEHQSWSNWKGYKPVCWDRGNATNPDRSKTGYWIIRCPAEIINDHNDIWNQQAMETYAALFRTAVVMKQ